MAIYFTFPYLSRKVIESIIQYIFVLSSIFSHSLATIDGGSEVVGWGETNTLSEGYTLMAYLRRPAPFGWYTYYSTVLRFVK